MIVMNKLGKLMNFAKLKTHRLDDEEVGRWRES